MALDPPIDATTEEVRDLLGPIRHDFTVALYAAANPFGVGAILRVAHNFLAREIILIGDAPHYEKASMGMEKYESIVRVDDEDAFLAHVGQRPLWAIEKDAATTSLHAVRGFPPDVVFLFGSERHGIPASLLARAACVVGIPIYGVNHSLPLPIATGIVMAEWTRQKYEKGALR